MNKCHSVKCIETGKRYLNVQEAAKENYICHSAIVAACRGRRKTAAGYHWEYCTPEEARREEVKRILEADPVFMAMVQQLKELSV